MTNQTHCGPITSGVSKGELIDTEEELVAEICRKLPATNSRERLVTIVRRAFRDARGAVELQYQQYIKDRIWRATTKSSSSETSLVIPS